MIKVRSGVFETNSSSTHTCVLCTHDNYVRWCKGELVSLQDKYDGNQALKVLITKYSKPEYIVDEDFADTRAFKDITLDKVFESSDWLLQKYNKLSSKYTIEDVWNIYQMFDYQDLEGDGNREFTDYYRAAKKKYPNIDEIQEIMNSFSDCPYPADEKEYEPWNHFFMYILGSYTINNICQPYMEQEDIKKKVFNGEEIVSFCVYGHD